MQPRYCDNYRPAVTTRPAQNDIVRRLTDYALGYAARLAERRR
jgi:hypothetical protein